MPQTLQLLNHRYHLRQQLGKNAGRQTWLAQDITTTPHALVIVKLLAFSPQMQWEEFKLFEREAQVLKSLNHPRLPRYRDYFSIDSHEDDGVYWFALVQDYIPGKSLQQLLDEGYHFSEKQVRSIAIQVLKILGSLHRLNPPILHRDIKPSNLILGTSPPLYFPYQEGQRGVYLIDFGAVCDATTIEGATFTVVGTAGYAPLEQFWGKAVPASDLYALGATLIHLATGIPPSDLPQENLRIQFRDRVSLEPELNNWLEALSEPNLERRFSSAQQALEALRTGFTAPPIKKPRTSQIWLKKSRHKLRIELPRSPISVDKVLRVIEKLLAVLLFSFLCLPLWLCLMWFVLIFIAPFILITISDYTLSFGLFALIPPVILLCVVFVFIFQKVPGIGTLEVLRLANELKKAFLDCFGCCFIEINTHKSFLRLGKNLSIFKAHNDFSLYCDRKRFKAIELALFKKIVISEKLETFLFGYQLAEAEHQWLLYEIKNWLNLSSSI